MTARIKKWFVNLVIKVLGDTGKPTVQGARILSIFLVLSIALLAAVVWTGAAYHQNQKFLNENTTPKKTTLTFGRSGTPVVLSGVWTDSSHKVIVAKLHYSDQSHQTLPSEGKKYLLYLIGKSGTLPKNVTMKYGLMGTDGDGFLFLKGNFSNKGYQVLIDNFSHYTPPTSTAAQSSTTYDNSSNDDTVTADLSSYTFDNVDNKGLLKFGGITVNKKTKATPKADTIDFRINPYSAETSQYKGTFLKDGDFDYSKIIQVTTVDIAIRKAEKVYKQDLSQIKSLTSTKAEYDNRLKINPDDKIALKGSQDAGTALNTANDNKEKHKEKLDDYKNQKFNRSTFGQMQEKGNELNF